MQTAKLLLVLLSVAAAPALAQDGADQSSANNPLTPKITFNVHDYYAPEPSGPSNADSNQALLRGLIPHKSFGTGQLFRFTMPIVSAPSPTGDVTDAGDLTLQNIFPFKTGRIELGVGPLVVLPTAGKRATGSGKWQAGAVGMVVAPQKWGLFGGLLTYQHSIAGDDDRADVSLMTAQPILIYNLPKGFYLRSSGTLTFDLKGDADYIPIGAGIGKVWAMGGGNTINAFIEPQYTVWNHTDGTPKWQIFFGVNFQFAMHPRGGR